MKIGLTIRLFTPGSGGLQHHAESLVENLKSLGQQVTIVTRAVSRVPSYHDAFYFSEPAQLESKSAKIARHSVVLNPLMWIAFKCVHRSGTRWLGIRLYLWIYTSELVRQLNGVDLIHHIGQGAEMFGFAAAAAAKRLNVPFLVQPTAHPGQWGDKPIDLELYRMADRLLVHTKYEEVWLRSVGINNPIDVVGNGIDGRVDGNRERFRQSYGLSGPIIIFLGRKSEDKGYPLLLKAFEMVVNAVPDTTLICVGPSDLKGGAEGSTGVMELDYLTESEKHDALAGCDVLCVPSEAESFGLVYMEAACYRKALVARNLPVLRELLDGAAVLVGDGSAVGLNQIHITPVELAECLIDLLADKERMSELGDAAFERSRGFLWSKVGKRFLESYQMSISLTKKE